MAMKYNAKAMHCLVTVAHRKAEAVQLIAMLWFSSEWYQNEEKRNAKLSQWQREVRQRL